MVSAAITIKNFILFMFAKISNYNHYSFSLDIRRLDPEGRHNPFCKVAATALHSMGTSQNRL
jgi:hypothetical protein